MLGDFASTSSSLEVSVFVSRGWVYFAQSHVSPPVMSSFYVYVPMRLMHPLDSDP
jgi:hypothetical protein